MHLAQFLPPYVGGEERHVWNLAREMAARSHDVTLLGFATNENPPGASVAEGVRVVRVRSAASRLPFLYSDPSRPHALPLPDPAVSRAIRHELAGGGFDVVHAHNWIVNSAVGPAAATGVPLVMTLHDYSHICATKRLMEQEVTRCPGPSPRRCLSCSMTHYGSANGVVTLAANVWAGRRRAKRITDAAAVSSAVAHAVQVPENEWLHSARIRPRVIPNFIPDDIVLDEIPGTRPDAPLLFVGDLSRDKGVQVLLDAYRRLDAPPQLVLAGRNPTPDAWDFPPGSGWAGELLHHQVVELFRSARAVVVPSVWADPCPTVVLEAMAAGRPVIATASGGITDMVVDGRTGLLVSPGDVSALVKAITFVLNNPEAARTFGVAGRDRAREFTVGAVVARIEQMYADAIRDREVTACG
ncbi:glycosyltransferase family 4 protein [Mycobacterium sp. 1164985.4]|uniref:glycosyltransferase family 4 protein n=1 Tax=Mycobacterium sp. 1164985.4 TaxID=1834069 RepID=UPI001E5FE8BD|nr:glycosyltransferase family 4 protein [Mycobacterium sp. 1164985.4]